MKGVMGDHFIRFPVDSGEWRVHFHVPVFLEQMSGFGTTQKYLAAVIDLLKRDRACPYLEVETYTWDVLPAGLKIDLLDSIGREYEWVLRNFGPFPPPQPD